MKRLPSGLAQVRRALWVGITATVVAVGSALPAFAQPAMLTAQDPGSRINVRSQPNTQSYAPHYGYAGDAIEVLDATRGNDRYIWYYVKFVQSGAEGWIRSDLVHLLNPDDSEFGMGGC